MKKDTSVVQRTTRIYFERFCSKELENLEETDQFAAIYDLPKLNLRM